ncbi:MAG: acyl-CoA dehydrogenase family protein, partial [Planctomycetes bacterium]|nr:acyl-CoA dehydrogenase family protein [Planctomycetota bacterium]
MDRRIDTYLKPLIGEDRFLFFEEMVRFSDETIAPRILEWERSHQLIPDDAIRSMAELGLFGISIDERYDGQGGQHTDLVLMGLALGYHSQSVAITPGAA